ncbi:unnamed protein product [Prorocentrum cordatum]|uniref:Uncharacterized protein n=1 Tax=Prorocentrum cordatum TaxID=2364126 RepID=A0ABN9RGZ5_9DINO|nr:unnamed protein product [Polarella glacialis]
MAASLINPCRRLQGGGGGGRGAPSGPTGGADAAGGARRSGTGAGETPPWRAAVPREECMAERALALRRVAELQRELETLRQAVQSGPHVSDPARACNTSLEYTTVSI